MEAVQAMKKTLTSEWNDRIGHWIQRLQEDFYRPLGTIQWEYFLTRELLSTQEVSAANFLPYNGAPWGDTWEYAWFRSKVTLPKEAAGRRIVMDLHPGGESTIFLNGAPFGTYRADWIACPHHYLVDNTLTPSGKEGETFSILMETYAGHDFPGSPSPECAVGPVIPGTCQSWHRAGSRVVPGESTYGIWSEDAYQLYLDANTLYSLLSVIDQTSLRAAEIAQALEQFTKIAEFEQEPQARDASYRQAREVLRPALLAHNGSTMPDFYAIGNAHLDVVWLWPLAETIRKTARTFASQIRLHREYPEYRFLQSMPVLYELCRKEYPTLFDQICDAAKEGWWIPEGAMWVEPDTNIPSGESLVRQLFYGKKYFREVFGKESVICWLPDSFGYSGALPQILKGCGIQFLVTQKIFWSYNNDNGRFPYHYFYWKGIDGSNVTSFLPTSYRYRTEPKKIYSTWASRVQLRGLSSFMIPFGYGDGGAGPTRDHLEYIRREADLEGMPRVKNADPLEFFEEMEARGGPQVTYAGELYFNAHRGTFTSQAMIKQYNRRGEEALHELEMWGSLVLQSGQAFDMPQAERLWKELLFNQFHDILPGSAIGRVYEEAEFRMHAMLVETNNQAEAYRTKLVNPNDRNAVTVFNSLGFHRSSYVALPHEFGDGAQTAGGEPLFTWCQNDTVYGLITVPSCGMTTIYPSKQDISGRPEASCRREGDDYVLENSKVKVLVTEHGEVASFIRKETGTEFARRNMNRFHFYKDVPRIFDAWDIDENYREMELDGAYDVTVAPSAKEVGAVLEVTGRIGVSSFRQRIVLMPNSERLEFQTEVDWRELHRLLKVSFPVNVTTDRSINEIQFGYMERPVHRSNDYERERFEVCNHRYTALADQSHGAAVLNDCKYGVSTLEDSIELTLLRAPAAPQMRADNRVHRFTYAFYAWDGSFLSSKVVQEGLDMNIPLRAVIGAGSTYSFASVDCDNVIIDTVKPADDGSGDIILRLYESKRAACVVTLHCMAEIAFSCDLLENIEQELPVENHSVQLSFRAFEVKTIRIKCH